MSSASQQQYFPVFIAHRGPDAKHRAIELRAALEKKGVAAFVDETDLEPCQAAQEEIKANLHIAKVAVVLFTQEFFKSTWCCQELEIVLELRKREGRPYLPVFLGLTADEVFKEARSIHGVQFANEAAGITAVRHTGERRNSPVWVQTAKSVCDAVLKVPGIKEQPCGDILNLYLDCKPRWQLHQEELQALKVEASQAAAALPSAERMDVWILCHSDTVHFAERIREQLQKQQVTAFRAEQPQGAISVQAQGAHLLGAELAIVVYCGCFFDKACQQLMRLVAEYNKPYIAVCYTADNEKIKNNATDAAGSGFAKQVLPDGVVLVSHINAGKQHGKRDSQTINEVLACVRVFIPIPSAAATVGPPPPPARPLLMWGRLWQQAHDLWSMPPCPMVSTVQHKTTLPQAAAYHGTRGEVACMLQVPDGVCSATGRGCILQVSELPAACLAGPKFLLNSVQYWALGAAEQAGFGTSSRRIFAASAGGGMVAWCPQGWGLFLPPDAPDAPRVNCPTPIFAVDRNSKGALLPLQLVYRGRDGDGSSSEAGKGDSSAGSTTGSALLDSAHVIISDGLKLHSLPLEGGLRLGVQLPPQLLQQQELLLLSVGTGSYFCSESIPVLVLEAGDWVVQELNAMALAHPDVPVVSGLYHVLLQPHSHLQAWAQHAAAHGLGTDPEAAAAESRATAAHCLLVLAIQQDAVMAAEWLLSSLEELHGAAQGNAPSTLSALVQHQRRAWETGSDQDKLQMLAGAREMAMQQVFATWSVRHLLPTAVPTSSKVAELLQGATALIQQRVKSDAAAHAAAVSAEWSQLAADRSLLQASSVQESVTVLGPAGDLAAAVMSGSDPDNLQQLLEVGDFSRQELQDALHLAVMMGPGRTGDLQLLLQHVWQQAGAVGTDSSSSSSSDSSGSSRYAVPAWCMGALGSSSGVQKWLQSEATGQATVAALLQHLQAATPLYGQVWLFSELPRYQEIRTLASGRSSWVVLARELLTGKEVAIKRLRLMEGSRPLAYALREAINLQRLNHPHIVKLYDVALSPNHVNIVLEYINGGTLLDYVNRHGKLSEAHARWFFQQLMLAVDYCHKRDVAARDIKLENCLLKTPAGMIGSLLKLTDFDLSAEDLEQARSKVGTINYMAPEVIASSKSKPYDSRAADMWGCGVLLYAMLLMRYPFKDAAGGDLPDWMQLQVRMGPPQEQEWFKHVQAAQLSAECQDLLLALLQPNPAERITMAGVLKHPWFVQGLPEGALSMSDHCLSRAVSQAAPTEDAIRRVFEAAASAAPAALTASHNYNKWDILVPAPEQLKSVPSADTQAPREQQLPAWLPPDKVVPAKALIVSNELGRGAFAVVQCGAWQAQLVAVKTPLSPNTLQQQALVLTAQGAVSKEAQLMLRLDHPNVISLLGVCLERPALVLQLAQLDAVAALSQGHPAWEKRLSMLLDAACGLTYLHSKGIVHGDVRASNLLLTAEGVAKLCDFGLAARLDGACSVAADHGTTHPFWAAPELLADKRMSTFTDTYAFGTLMYEVLSGGPPFGLLTADEVHRRLINLNGKSLLDFKEQLCGIQVPGALDKEIKEAFIHLMLQCWAVAPAERPSLQHIHSQLSGWHRQLLEAAANAAREAAAEATVGVEQAQEKAVQAEREAYMAQAAANAGLVLPCGRAGGDNSELHMQLSILLSQTSSYIAAHT